MVGTPENFNINDIWKSTANVLGSAPKYKDFRISTEALNKAWPEIRKEILKKPLNEDELAKVISEKTKLPKDAAKFMATEYAKKYATNLQKVGDRHFPSDAIIRMAMSMVNQLHDANPGSVIHIKNAENRQIVEAIKLYATARNIPYMEHSAYQHYKGPDAATVKIFEKLVRDKGLETGVKSDKSHSFKDNKDTIEKLEVQANNRPR